MKNSSLKFYDYHIWANNKVFAHLQTLPQNVTTEEVTSVFPSIKDTLVHMYVVDHGWLSTILRDESSDIDEMKERVEVLAESAQKQDITGLQKLYDDLYLEFREAFNEINDFDQIESIFFGQLDCSYHDMITHIVNHGTYHRGNITAMLRQLEFTGCNTDYGAFLFEQQK
ncbi:DinB family protein [Peribacillus sp. NPDC096540]|uniref:DinB family protein n=1 Tax=Peribacillus sp. NPDC096540 TaxID=3390612 RepID=UPI003CFF23C5